MRVEYDKAAIDKHGSIPAAQFASVGPPMSATPDFSLPVPQDWISRVSILLPARADKLILVYRQNHTRLDLARPVVQF